MEFPNLVRLFLEEQLDYRLYPATNPAYFEENILSFRMSNNIKNALTTGRVADRFRSLMLAYSALSTDLTADLKQYDTSLEESQGFVNEVFKKNGSQRRYEA